MKHYRSLQQAADYRSAPGGNACVATFANRGISQHTPKGSRELK